MEDDYGTYNVTEHAATRYFMGLIAEPEKGLQRTDESRATPQTNQKDYNELF